MHNAIWRVKNEISDDIHKRGFVLMYKKQHIADKMTFVGLFISNRIILTKILGFFDEKYEKWQFTFEKK